MRGSMISLLKNYYTSEDRTCEFNLISLLSCIQYIVSSIILRNTPVITYYFLLFVRYTEWVIYGWIWFYLRRFCFGTYTGTSSFFVVFMLLGFLFLSPIIDILIEIYYCSVEVRT